MDKIFEDKNLINDGQKHNEKKRLLVEDIEKIKDERVLEKLRCFTLGMLRQQEIESEQVEGGKENIQDKRKQGI